MSVKGVHLSKMDNFFSVILSQVLPHSQSLYSTFFSEQIPKLDLPDSMEEIVAKYEFTKPKNFQTLLEHQEPERHDDVHFTVLHNVIHVGLCGLSHHNVIHVGLCDLSHHNVIDVGLCGLFNHNVIDVGLCGLFNHNVIHIGYVFI